MNNTWAITLVLLAVPLRGLALIIPGELQRQMQRPAVKAQE